LNDCVRSILLHVGMPPAYWVEALSTATHLINLRPCQSSGSMTPHQPLIGTAPDVSHLRVFGCLCYPNQSATAPHKLSPRSTPCALHGYPADHRGYRCLDLHTRHVITSRHVVFNEACFPFLSAKFQPLSTTTKPATAPNSADSPVITQTVAPLPPARKFTPTPPLPAGSRSSQPLPTPQSSNRSLAPTSSATNPTALSAPGSTTMPQLLTTLPASTSSPPHIPAPVAGQGHTHDMP
jgi:hypothetical protein